MASRIDPALKQLAERFGVTRLARLTGLDRCGVEVVGAVRPRGHVLQVSQGKGLTLEHARWSALGEAIELEAAENPDFRSSRARSRDRLISEKWDVGELSIPWVPAEQLSNRAPCLVPAQAVYCPPAGRFDMGPSVITWRSNGLGAHPTSRAAAEEHAVLELVERDALARVLPQGWTPHEALRRLVVAPKGAVALRARGFACFLFDLTFDSLPVAGALLFDLEGGAVPLTAGYACRRDWASAAEAAWLEAAQSRLTEIHGAREDVLIGARDEGLGLLRAIEGVTPRVAPRRVERRPLGKVVKGDVSIVQLREKPFVVKAVSPELLVSELL